MWICKCKVGLYDEALIQFPNGIAVCSMLYICVSKFTDLYVIPASLIITLIQN